MKFDIWATIGIVSSIILVIILGLIGSNILFGTIDDRTNSKRKTWKETVSKYPSIMFSLFIIGYSRSPDRWKLYPNNVKLDNEPLSFATYSDYKKYQKFNKNRLDEIEKHERDMAEKKVLLKVFEMYNAKSEGKKK